MVDEALRRGISAEFERQLTEGILHPLLQRVHHDDTLTLEIRNGYIDIYYRGGRLLGIHEQAGGQRFSTQFDERYCGTADDYQATLPERPGRIITAADDSIAWVDAFSHYKQAMDIRFCKHPKLEREYQQAVLRDNNRHATGESSDYTIVDIEYAQSPRAFPEQEANYRFDMVGFRWPAAGKTRASGFVTPVIIEMKAGDNALTSPQLKKDSDELTPGLIKHVLDFERFLTPDPGEEVSRPYAMLCEELVDMFGLKQRLGLPSLPQRMRDLEITAVNPRPEILFVLANHQPSSTILARELKKLPAMTRADYRIATVSYAGYALYADNLKTVEEIIALEEA